MTHPESTIQHQIVMYLQSVGAFFFSIPNELAGGGKYAARRMSYFVATGLRKGAPDLEVWHRSRTIYMEVKAENGRLSDSQKAFARKCAEMGREYHVVRSVQDVEEVLFGSFTK